MKNKILGIVCLALIGGTWAVIRHDDTAMSSSCLFFILGAYEYVLGDIRLRMLFKKEQAAPDAERDEPSGADPNARWCGSWGD